MNRIAKLFVIACTMASFCNANAMADTIGYWRFEEGTAGGTATGAGSVLDSSPVNPLQNPGNPNGNPTYSSDVPVSLVDGNANGTSLSFDGTNDHVLVPTDAALNSAGAFTVEFWMRSGGTGGGQDLLVDKSHGFVDNTGWFFQSNPGTGIIGFGLGNGGAFPGVGSLDDLFDDQWHHLAGTYDGSNIELFVDGVSQGNTAAGVYVANTRDIRFGNASNNGRFFAGELDEVRISDGVLSRSNFLLAVPEPSSALFGTALLSTLLLRRQRHTSAR